MDSSNAYSSNEVLGIAPGCTATCLPVRIASDRHAEPLRRAVPRTQIRRDLLEGEANGIYKTLSKSRASNRRLWSAA
jgi:hypothetical protein